MSAGTVLSYSFTPATGYQNIKVLVDGASANSAGQIVMDRHHSLLVSADTVIVLTQAETGLVKQIEQSVMNATPAALTRMLESAFDSLLLGNSDKASIATLGRAIALAVVPERDADKFARALSLPPTDGLSLSRGPAYNSGALGEKHTRLIFVNGVRVMPADYRLAWRGALYPLAQRLGLGVERGFDVGGFYNPSAIFDNPEVATFSACIHLKGNQITNGIGSALTSFRACMPALGLTIGEKRYLGGDFVEALAQVINLAVFKQPALVQPDAIRLADTMIAARRAGQRIVLVTHSQGNLLAEEAQLRLSSTSSWTSQDRSCVGWVAIAPPRAPSTSLTGVRASAMIIRGTLSQDILETLFRVSTNTSVRPVTNELSNDYDSQGWLWSRVLGLFGAATGVSLHSVVASYFGMPTTEKLIGDALVEQIDAIDSQCLTPTATLQISSNTPTSWTLSPGSGGNGSSVTTSVRAARTGSDYVLTPASIAGRNVSVANSNGGGARITLYPGDAKNFTITYVSPTAAPSVTLSANPSTVAAGQSSTLTWTSTGAQSCGAPWTSSTALSGNQSVTPGVTTTYTISCRNAAATGSAEATVTVAGQPSLAAPSVLSATATSTLVSLAWNDNSANEEGFKVERAPTGSTTFAEIGATGPNVAAYIDRGVNQSTSYSYRVRAFHTSGNSGYSNVVSVTIPATGSCPLPIVVDTSITVAATWTPGQAGCVHYLVRGTISVWGLLRIQGGTLVNFARDAQLTVQGSVTAVGTPASPIRFLGEQPVRGYWRGLTFASASAANELSYVEVAHAGGDGSSDAANVRVNAFDRLRLTNSLLRESAGVGLYVGGNAATLPGFSTNMFRNNAGPGIRLPDELLGALDLSSDYVTGNGRNYLDAYGTSVNIAQTWRITSAPIRFTGSTTIWSALTIAPGMTFQFGPGVDVSVRGSVTAIGTPASPIRFLGEQPVRGYWRGLTFASASAANELSYVEVAHAGGDGSSDAANVRVNAFDRLRLTNSLLRESAGWGLFVDLRAVLSPTPVSGAGNVFNNNARGGSNVP